MVRISQTPVPTLWASAGPVDVLLLGEAPGPRGADQSGIPFWGDRAGVQVYRALLATGRAEVPEAAFEDWDGARLKAQGRFPRLLHTALGNAYPICPTADGHTFRAPTDRELKAASNLQRLQQDLTLLRERCDGVATLITLGKRAAFVAGLLDGEGIRHVALPHPSAQGLLQAAPNQGKGLRLADLQASWEEALRGLLHGR